jgi:site-specific DNA-cytosine methylase
VTGGPPCQPFSLGGSIEHMPTRATCGRKLSGLCARRARERSCSRT